MGSLVTIENYQDFLLIKFLFPNSSLIEVEVLNILYEEISLTKT